MWPLGPGEEMGARTSLLEVSEHGSVLPSPTLENIQAAYDDKQVEVARELIRQASCVECSAGIPRVGGVSHHKNKNSLQTLSWLVKYCHGLTAPHKKGSYCIKG